MAFGLPYKMREGAQLQLAVRAGEALQELTRVWMQVFFDAMQEEGFDVPIQERESMIQRFGSATLAQIVDALTSFDIAPVPLQAAVLALLPDRAREVLAQKAKSIRSAIVGGFSYEISNAIPQLQTIAAAGVDVHALWPDDVPNPLDYADMKYDERLDAMAAALRAMASSEEAADASSDDESESERKVAEAPDAGGE